MVMLVPLGTLQKASLWGSAQLQFIRFDEKKALTTRTNSLAGIELPTISEMKRLPDMPTSVLALLDQMPKIKEIVAEMPKSSFDTSIIPKANLSAGSESLLYGINRGFRRNPISLGALDLSRATARSLGKKYKESETLESVFTTFPSVCGFDDIGRRFTTLYAAFSRTFHLFCRPGTACVVGLQGETKAASTSMAQTAAELLGGAMLSEILDPHPGGHVVTCMRTHGMKAGFVTARYLEALSTEQIHQLPDSELPLVWSWPLLPDVDVKHVVTHPGPLITDPEHLEAVIKYLLYLKHVWTSGKIDDLRKMEKLPF